MDRTILTPEATRRTALVAGLLYLATFVFSIPAYFLMGPALTDPTWILGSGDDTRVITGALFDLVTALAGIGTAVALFTVVKRQHEGLALGFVTSRIYEAGLMLIGVVSILAVVTLRQEAAGANSETLVIAGGSLVAVREWTALLGPGLAPALNALLLGTLLLRSGLVPRILPAVGLFAAPVLLTGTLGIAFGVNEPQSAWTGIATVPIFCWELGLGLYLTFKGFRRSAALFAGSTDNEPSLIAPATTQRISEAGAA